MSKKKITLQFENENAIYYSLWPWWWQLVIAIIPIGCTFQLTLNAMIWGLNGVDVATTRSDLKLHYLIMTDTTFHLLENGSLITFMYTKNDG